MYTVIILGSIGIIIAVWILLRDCGFDWKDFEDYALGLLMSFIGFITGGLVGLVIAFALPMTYVTDKWDVDLVSLQDNNGIHGSFFLGSGQINNRMQYVFYYKISDSTYKMAQHDFDDCTIKYTEAIPKEFITWHHPNNSTQNKFAIDITGSWSTYLFQVPKGSIKNNYQLDAQ